MVNDVRLTAPVRLPWGYASILVAGGNVRSVVWERSAEVLRARARKEWPGAEWIPAESNEAGLLLQAYAGKKPVPPSALRSIPFEWGRLTGFSRDVLGATLRIPFAAVATYGEVARRAGHTRAARAVGRVLSRNPWPVLIPCHRVIGSTGALVGFGKGEDAKRILLEFERGGSGALPNS